MRCFVALLPGRESLPALAGLLRGMTLAHPQARPVHPADLHLTLAFIGELPEARARALATELAQRPSPQAPPWQLDRFGSFPRARVLWAGGPPLAALDALATEVRAWLDAQRVGYDRKRFLPHVTLLRKLASAGEAAAGPIEPPIGWPLSAPTLLAARQTPSEPRYAIVTAASPPFGCDQAGPNP